MSERSTSKSDIGIIHQKLIVVS